MAEDGEVAPLSLSEEEINPHAQDDLTLHASPIEPLDCSYPIDVETISRSSSTELAYFEDGRQRTIQIGHIPVKYGNDTLLIPVHYFIVAAVIVERTDRRLKLWSPPIQRQGIIIQRSLVPDQSRLKEYEDRGLLIVDTDSTNSDYYELRRLALLQAKDQRLEIENEIIAQWRQNVREDRFLVVDGTLMNFRNEENVERCVGVSKSFGSRYFSAADHNRIMRMPASERSWLFRFHEPDDPHDDARFGARDRISWYLRLRYSSNRDPEFGLVRVEVSKRHADKASDLANCLSAALLADRFPTAYPTPRWDKHLYPIKACESYLSSIMPSIQTVSASMRKVGP